MILRMHTPKNRPSLALFDFDSTITTRDLFADFARFAAPRLRVQIGGVLFAPVLLGYKFGWVPGTWLRAGVVGMAFWRRPTATLRERGVAFAQQIIPGVLRAQAMQQIQWHQQRGDTVVVVSGGLDLYLQPWCAQHGLALLCSALAEHPKHARLSGRYQGQQCVGAEKARRIRAHYDLASFHEIYAYGDSKDDLAMLALAQHKYYRWQKIT
jgi:phosphatidylglycerophosphatase C